MVEFCSVLSKAGSKYAYTEGTDKKFYAIGCECLDDNYAYKSYKQCNQCQIIN